MPTPGVLARKTISRELISSPLRCRLIPVAGRVAAMLNRRTEVVLHRLDDAKDSGLGALEAQHEILDRHGRLAAVEEAVKLVNPIELCPLSPSKLPTVLGSDRIRAEKSAISQ